MVLADGAIVGERVLDEEVAIHARVLVETLVRFVEVHTVRLNPCRHPGLVFGVGVAVRKVQFVRELVVLAFNAQHLEQVNVGRTGGHHAVYDGVTRDSVVHQQGVRGRNVAVDGIVVNAIAVCIVVIARGRTYHVVEHPGVLVVSLDGGLHEQCSAQHVGNVAIQALHIFAGIGKTHTILTAVRINNAGAEIDELGFHGVVHTGGETLVVWSGTLQCSRLLEVVETYIISIVSTAAAEVHVVVLANAGFEHFLEPVGVGVVHETILARCGVEAVTAGQRCVGVGAGLTQILAVLVGIHHVVGVAGYPVYAEVAFVVDLQGLVFLTVLGGDDDHTVSGTRTVDGTCRCVFEHLNGFNVVRREVADGGSHGHTVDNVERSGAAERTDTTNAHRGVGTGLTVGGDLHTRHLTFEHGGDVGVGNAFQLLGVHNRYRTGEVGLLLSTVTHHNHLVEHVVVGCQLNLAKVGAAVHGHFHFLVTDVADNKGAVAGNIYREVTIEVGNNSRLRALHLDGGTNEGLSLLVNDLAADLDGLLRHSGHGRSGTQCEPTHGTHAQHDREQYLFSHCIFV